jgi:Flp pilus assembly protein TadD
VKTLEEFPKDFHAYNLLGLVHLNQGNYSLAVDSLAQAFALAPGHYGIAFNLGLAYERNNQIAQARSCYQRVLQLKPDVVLAKEKLSTLVVS